MSIVPRPSVSEKSCYRCYLVRPIGDFQPKNWQDRPKRFSIIKAVAAWPFLGNADAWRFMQNHPLVGSQNPSQWAIWLR
jgi:hypothetical protein